MTDSPIEHSAMIAPSAWVVRHAARIAAGGRVLDLACGSGRHACLLAGRGHPVLAVDRDATALSGLADVAGVSVLCADLEAEDWPLAGASFSGIVVANYLWRPRLADVCALLAPDGILIYETFMVGHEAYGKPSSPAFLLQPGELRRVAVAAGLRELDFFEGCVTHPGPAVRQAICAVRAGD